MAEFVAGSSVTWKGKDYTILSFYDQPMVQIVDAENKGQSVPLARLVADMMRPLKEELK
tara:strand:- start:131 stop:307 length:177 start_codon:yes stop_codon:yes gene_type:complete